MALEPTRQLRFISPAELPFVVGAHEGWHHQLPPPGCRIAYREPLGAMGVLPDIVGTPEDGSAGDRWWASLGDVAFGNAADVVEVAGRLAGLIDPAVRAVFAVTDVPVVYDQGGETVRWISSTFRGTLGTVEQFQFGINWGNPGADPDPNEAETLAFAQLLRDQWQSNLATMQGDQALLTMFPSDVKFTEVGAVVKEQTSATASDGTGGDLSQKFDTQWAAYAVGGIPTGAASSAALPYEVSCAVTLQTDKRGPSGRGRIYLPPFATGYIGPGGKYTASTIATAGKAVGAFFAAVESASGHVPIVVSRRRLVLNEVTSVNVGLVPDAQRRRRRSQDEGRVTEWTKP